MVVATLQGQITLDAARTYSALELTAPINQQHMKAFSVIFAAQVDLVDGPPDRKKQDEASTRAVRHRWLAAANAFSAIYPVSVKKISRISGTKIGEISSKKSFYSNKIN